MAGTARGVPPRHGARATVCMPLPHPPHSQFRPVLRFAFPRPYCMRSPRPRFGSTESRAVRWGIPPHGGGRGAYVVVEVAPRLRGVGPRGAAASGTPCLLFGPFPRWVLSPAYTPRCRPSPLASSGPAGRRISCPNIVRRHTSPFLDTSFSPRVPPPASLFLCGLHSPSTVPVSCFASVSRSFPRHIRSPPLRRGFAYCLPFFPTVMATLMALATLSSRPGT